MSDTLTDEIADTLATGADAYLSDEAEISEKVEEQSGENLESENAQAEVSDQIDVSDPDKLAAELRNAKAEAAKYQKSYRELQSRSDRHEADLNKKMARIEGLVEGLTQSKSNPKEDQVLMAKEQEEFDKKWKQEIEENPSKAIDFVRGVLADVDDLVEKKLQARLSGVEAKVTEYDPVYRENQIAIKALMENGFDRDSAMKAVVALKQKNIVRQPEKPAAPGIANNATRVSASKPVNVTPLTADPVLRSVWAMAGIDEKAQKEIAMEVAKSLR